MHHSTEKQLLSVEAICVNQDDEKEWNCRVCQVGDIFSKANRVRVWLGESSRYSHRGIDVMKTFHDRLPHTYSTQSLPKIKSRQDFDDHYRPILPLPEQPSTVSSLNQAVLLLYRPWWKIMWTLQGSVLGKEVFCYVGDTSFPIECFYTFHSPSNVRDERAQHFPRVVPPPP